MPLASNLRTKLFCGLLSLTAAVIAPPKPAWAAAATQEGFRAWLREFRATAIAKGIDSKVYDSTTAGLTADFNLPDLEIVSRPITTPEQAEFVRTPEGYLNEKNMASLVQQGRRLYATHKDVMARIEKTYDADPYILLALWGRETAFGTVRDPYNAIKVLATQAYIGRRTELFRNEFVLAIRLVQDGVIQPKDMYSSWAGAMGLMQFLPSDYYKFGVTAEGGERPDIWNSVPDALASLANNLKHLGWEPGKPWGLEVKVPKQIDCTLAKLDIKKPVREWAALGVAPVSGSAFDPAVADAEASLLMPAGTFGPAFLTFQNFQVLREYNRADLYALFVGHLADRIAGREMFAGKWEKVVQVATTDVEDLQRRLTALQLYSDTVDGKAGGRTRSAVGLYQKQAGLAQTCWPTADIVEHIRQSAAAKPLSALSK